MKRGVPLVQNQSYATAHGIRIIETEISFTSDSGNQQCRSNNYHPILPIVYGNPGSNYIINKIGSLRKR